MVFAVHPNVNVLKKIVGSAPVSLVYDSSRRRFIIAPQEDTVQKHPEPLRAMRVRSKQSSVTAHLERVP